MEQLLNPRRSLISNKVSFLIAGAAIAAWAPLIPFIKERFALSENQLGSLLLCVGIGSILASPVAGVITSRCGCRLPIYLASLIWGVCLIAVSFLQNIYMLAGTLVIFGMAAITLEIVSNINGSLLEKLTGHNVMSGLHALYSVGSLTGSAGVTFILGAKFGIEVAAISAACCLWLLLLIGGRSLVKNAKMFTDDYAIHVSPIETDSTAPTNSIVQTTSPIASQASESKESKNTKQAHSAMQTSQSEQKSESLTEQAPSKTRYITNSSVLLVGLMLFIIYLLEGAMLDWSGVFLFEVRNLPIEQGGYGFAAFAVTMVVFRMLGDRMVEKFGRRLIIVCGTLLIFVSLTLAVIVPSAWLSILCFALAGMGSSNVIPQLVSFAGKIEEVPMHVAVTLVNAIGFTGVLAGPALIGFLAHLITLSYTFVFLGCLVLVVGLISFILMRKKTIA